MGHFAVLTVKGFGQVPVLMVKHVAIVFRFQTFRKRLLRRSVNNNETRNITKIRNDYLTIPEKDTRIKALQTSLDKKESQVFFALQENIRLKYRTSN